MSKLDEILDKLETNSVLYAQSLELPSTISEAEFEKRRAKSKQQIRELCQGVLLEYKDTSLGHEGVKILNELHEKFGKL